jgi:uncharacterized membrane protein YcaP (DUF421 family)
VDAVVRTVAVYLVLMLIFRLTGKRTLGQVTTFDFVLLLVVSEATQQALLGEDYSITQAAVVIAVLVALDRLSDFLSFRSTRFQRVAESIPIVLIENGVPVREAMDKEHISEDEILQAARSSQGLENLEQVKHAVLETSGGISVIPWEQR